MPKFMLTLVVLSQVVLSAHALRRGELGLAVAVACVPVLLLSRRGWTRLVNAAVLLAGAAQWVATGLSFVQMRQAFGEPWVRLALILGVVCVVALAGCLWLLGQGARRLFDREVESEAAQALAFGLTAGGLALARAKAGVAVLLADRFLPGSGWIVVLGLATYAAWLAGRFLDPAAHRRLRPRVWALFSAMFFGQLLMGLAGAEQFLMTGKLHLPVPALIAAGPIFRGGGWFMPILFASTVLLVGPAWCSHLCYIGAWDDQCSRLGPKGKSRGTVSRGWSVGGRLAVLALACGGALGLRLVDAPMWLAAALAAGLGLVGVGAMLLASRRMGVMAHCTAFCPMGLVGNVLGRLVPWRMGIDKGACTGCGACARVCRYSALDTGRIEAGRPGLSCTLCGDCAGACAHGAMGYRFPGLSARAARAAFLTLVAALHAVFLGVARI